MNSSTLAAITLAAASSCATPQFNYKWYGIDPSAGKLLGPTEADDLSLSLCQGDAQQQGKCAVMFVDEFDRLRTDYISTKIRLEECERGN